MSYTAGPWRVEDIGVIEGLAIMAPDRPGSPDEYRIVAMVSCDEQGGILLQETEANARLIAAAPEMYEALEIARFYVAIADERTDRNVYKDLATIKHALAMAELGRQP